MDMDPLAKSAATNFGISALHFRISKHRDVPNFSRLHFRISKH
jgi:hypothetical protein